MRTALFLLLSVAFGATAEITLVENGRANAVVVAGDADAAGEFCRYVERISGTRLPMAGQLPVRVLVGMSACPAEVRARIRGLGRDAYVIEARPGMLILAGNGRDGTAFAVYDFLERYAGVRWLWPGDLGEVVPHAKVLRVPPVALVKAPAFLWRNLGPGGALWGPLDKWQKERELGVTVAHQREQALWEKRNRFGGETIYGGHAMGEILPPSKYGPTHPEYFALVNGKRVWENFNGKHGKQPCTTNPDVIRITREYCQRMFREHPEYDAVSISANDGRGFCECDRCRRLDTGALMKDRDDPEAGRGGDVPIITDRMVTFANQVAEGVVKSNPGKKVLMFAYGQYVRPPTRVKAHPAVIVAYTMRCASWWDPKAAQAADADLVGWRRAVPAVGVYEYFTQTNFPDMPRLYPALIERSVRRLHDLGFRYYQTQAGDGYAINGVNFYVLARLLWEPQADAGAIQRDYVQKGFGEAAPAVERYFNRLAAAWRDAADSAAVMNYPRISEYRRVLELYPPELRDRCRADLEEAARVATGKSLERVRFLQAGFRYFEMTMQAVENTLPLLESGWKFGRNITPPTNPDLAVFARARTAWEARDRYVESLKNDFVLSYLWISSNDYTRTFSPLLAMRQWRQP